MFGLKMGSTATTGAGLIASGAAAAAGGVVGGATLISGGIDAYHAIKSDEEAEKKAYGTSAGLKIGGVAAGAAIGTAILPGIGTLIGAGIGGIAGWFGGNKVKEDYEETKQAAEEAAAAAELMEQKSKYALEGSRFENSKLKDAFNDTTVSAERFASMMQEAASKKVQDSFGNIKLSVKEIKDAAKQIVFGDQEQAFTKFSSAASDAQNSLANLQSSVSTMDKLNWKASLGMKFDDNEISEYIAGVDNMLSSASQYLEDKHYQAKAAIDLLVEPGNETDMTTGLNAMYADMQSKIESLGKDLHAKVNVALEDGVITLDEQAEITNLQNQITDITNQISQAETEASFQSLKVKYSGASLDADSFANLVAEIQTNVQEAAQSYDDALEVSLTNLNLQLQSGAINQEQFDAQLQALTEGYQAKITDLSVRVESFELQSIADAFGSELDGILPDIEGTVAEKLGTAMHNAMAAGVDVENWDVSTASQWLDLDGLSAETQSAITELMSQVAASLPDQMSSALSGTDIDMSDSVNSMVNSSIENVDLSGAGETLMGKVNESMNGLDMSESGAGLYFDETGIWGNISHPEYPKKEDFLHGSPFCHAPCMVRKEAYDAVKGYTEKKRLLRVEDYHLWIKMYEVGYRGKNIPKQLYLMRDDKAAYKRRKFRYRVNEAYVRGMAVRKLGLPISGYLYAIQPIIIGILPKVVYDYFHKRKLESNSKKNNVCKNK